MPRDTTPTYVVEIRSPGYNWTPAPWNCKRDGRPTEKNLAAHIASFEASTQPGECNAHLGATRVARAWIRRNYAGAPTIASYAPAPAPAFTVVA